MTSNTRLKISGTVSDPSPVTTKIYSKGYRALSNNTGALPTKLHRTMAGCIFAGCPLLIGLAAGTTVDVISFTVFKNNPLVPLLTAHVGVGVPGLLGSIYVYQKDVKENEPTDTQTFRGIIGICFFLGLIIPGIISIIVAIAMG